MPPAPGELRGEFSNDNVLGTVLANDATGVYGSLNGGMEGQVCPVANSQEIQPGAAQILATVEGTRRSSTMCALSLWI